MVYRFFVTPFVGRRGPSTRLLAETANVPEVLRQCASDSLSVGTL